MSVYWSERAVTQTASICITSPAAIVDALEQMGCKVHTKLTAVNEAIKAQSHYEKCLKELENIAPMSLQKATEFEQAIDKTIQASLSLTDCLEKANNERPEQIQFTDSSGTRRTLNRKAGAYILEWQDIERSNNYGQRETRVDHASRNLSNKLIKTSEETLAKRSADEKRAMAAIQSRDANLREQMDKAIKIREKWQAIEDNKRVQTLRQERASEIESRGAKMGFKCKRVVNNKDEIVISMRRRV